MAGFLQQVIHALYPPQCVACDQPTASDFGLCGACWAQTTFLGGTICSKCGAPLPGAESGDNLQCDDCMRIARPWDQGRAAIAYAGVGRRLVLGLKHRDRTDLTWPASGWMAHVAAPLIAQDTLIVPTPLHWSRLLKRRYNQAALLATDLGKRLDREAAVTALIRTRATPPLDKVSREARFQTLSDVIAPHPKHGARMMGRPVLLVDDVMTSGATLAACAEAALRAGADRINVITLARVVKDL